MAVNPGLAMTAFDRRSTNSGSWTVLIKTVVNAGFSMTAVNVLLTNSGEWKTLFSVQTTNVSSAAKKQSSTPF